MESVEGAVLLYFKKKMQAWEAELGNQRLQLPTSAMHKLDGENMRPFGNAERRSKPQKRDSVLLKRDNGVVVAWAVKPSDH